MLLTAVRSSLQSRLVSLYRRQSRNNAPNIRGDQWLTQLETVQMLQPHMPNRNVFAWLELDRNVDPSLRYYQQEGEIAYRFADVQAFIQRLPKNNSGSNVCNSAIDLAERRTGGDRRGGTYLFGLNDRRKPVDRRGGCERRLNVDRRRHAIGSVLGRKGDRRRSVGNG
jgi:hypothetical protein